MTSKSKNRPEKGKSLLDKYNDYVVVDLETTGFSPYYDEIIELAALKVRNGVVVDSYQRLVHPQNKISKFISQHTGITNQMVENAPPIKEVLFSFMKFIDKDVAVGHNIASFDVNFLYDNMLNCLGIGFHNDFLDTMRVAKLVFPNLPKYTLASLCNYCKVDAKDAHRALSDCRMTHDLLQFMYKRLLEDDRLELYKKKYSQKSYKQRRLDIRNISASVNVEDIDKTNPLYGKKVVFTGKLERYLRKDAMQIVVNLGGQNQKCVTTETDYLVLGCNNYCSSVEDKKSTKLKDAEKKILNGSEIIILDEQTFYDMINDYEYSLENV